MSETFSTHEKAINTEQIAVVQPRGKAVIGTCTAKLFLAINFICLVICHDSVITAYSRLLGEKLCTSKYCLLNSQCRMKSQNCKHLSESTIMCVV